MNTPKFLLTAFRGTSSEDLLRPPLDYDTIILPNDRIKDSEKVITHLTDHNPSYIISFGQKPNIRDKIHIETCARSREVCFTTDFDADRLKLFFDSTGIPAKISQNTGTSFCNQLYYNVLLHLNRSKSAAKMVFIHVPFRKNITDFADFKTKILTAISKIDNSY